VGKLPTNPADAPNTDQGPSQGHYWQRSTVFEVHIIPKKEEENNTLRFAKKPIFPELIIFELKSPSLP
jgi:hypothetical protein